MRCGVLFWAGLMLLVLPAKATSTECLPYQYDRYGLYGVGHPAGGYILGDPPDYEDMVWRRIAEAGATSVRMAASWREIEAVRGQYDWSQVESTLKYCRKYPQIRPYLLVVNTPGWARADGKPSHLPPVSEAIPDWKRFCRALAERYRGFVRHYEIWNEQNGFGWEVPPYNQFDRYLPLLEAAYDGLKEGDPDCVVALGGLDDAEGHAPIFTKGCYDLRLKDYGNKKMWDAFGNHPYGDTKSMIAKLRAIKGIAAGYGDGGIELWLTEYGFHSGQMSLEEQAEALTDYMKTLILDPEFSYVTETNYLCVADFEQTTRGFGLCDVNLRPRPAFYAYQRLPRPGQIVISDIEVHHVRPDVVVVNWKTDTAASGEVILSEVPDGSPRRIVSDTEATEHSVTLDRLNAGADYSFVIRCTAPGFPEAVSLDYDLHTLAESGLRNGGFEEGFQVQIARHWHCSGRNLCWDAARLPEQFRSVRSGGHAQAIVANGAWGDGLDDAVAAQAPAVRGAGVTFSVWTKAATENEQGSIVRRVGIDPTGGLDPKSTRIVWSSESTVCGVWERQTVTAVADAEVVTVFAHASSEARGKGKDFFYVDDAEVVTHR